MHVFGFHPDLNSLLQFVFTALLLAFGFLYLVKNTASKYFEVDANFDAGGTMPGMPVDDACIVCANPGNKKCSRCKSVRYCSQECQTKDWSAGHKNKCKTLQSSGTLNSVQTRSRGGSRSGGIALIPASKDSTTAIMQTKKVLFPYEEFVQLFNWNVGGFPPCGLINCGNSCYANVVLQCLSCTRPLVAYLLEKGHRRECRYNDWCFLCELQLHVERASRSQNPFSPLSILSRLPNLGGDLGYGRQEDAHEFMRFAIDTMQSVCLDDFGGEKAVHPSSQETTLVQHIFGGHLQSQVICTKCDKVSNQYENMMDLTVEIHGDASSLEECLNQYTTKEWLHGENMYKCDGCNDYVKAWKRLTVKHAPNVLTIALKRFQSGRFGKLNKRVAFPETLDLSPYMNEAGDGSDVYKLYAVVVHLDMLNASYFGHYICYTKDFHGNWYRIDDCKVESVDLDEVLSQGAYMLLYSRVSPRPSCLKTTENTQVNHQKENAKGEPFTNETTERSFSTDSVGPTCSSDVLSSGSVPIVKELSSTDDKGQPENLDKVSSLLNASSSSDRSMDEKGVSPESSSEVLKEVAESMDVENTWSSSRAKVENSRCEEESSVPNNNGAVKELENRSLYNSQSCALLSVDCNGEEGEVAKENTENGDALTSGSNSDEKVSEVYGNGHATAIDTYSSRKVDDNLVSDSFSSTDKTVPKINNLKGELHCISNVEDRNGATEV